MEHHHRSGSTNLELNRAIYSGFRRTSSYCLRTRIHSPTGYVTCLEEFIGLRPKSYSIKFRGRVEDNTVVHVDEDCKKGGERDEIRCQRKTFKTRTLSAAGPTGLAAERLCPPVGWITAPVHHTHQCRVLIPHVLRHEAVDHSGRWYTHICTWPLYD